MTQSSKRRHGLAGCSTIDNFLNRFREETGWTMMEMVAAMLPESRAACVAIVGSIPWGIASDRSDIDVVVVIEGASTPRLIAPAGATELFNGISTADSGGGAVREIVVVKEGIEIDVHAVCETWVTALDNQLARTGGQADPNSITLVTRLKRGWLVHQTVAVKESLAGIWQNAAVDIAAAVRHIIFALKNLQYARHATESNPVLALQLGRGTVEQAYAAYLAKVGFPFGPKWLRLLTKEGGLRWLAKDGDRAFSTLLDNGVELLFPTYVLEPVQTASYLGRVEAFLTAVRRELEREVGFAVAFRLARQVKFHEAVSG
jgi:hypothetical protein